MIFESTDGSTVTIGIFVQTFNPVWPPVCSLDLNRRRENNFGVLGDVCDLVSAGANSTVFHTRLEIVAEVPGGCSATACIKTIEAVNPIAALIVICLVHRHSNAASPRHEVMTIVTFELLSVKGTNPASEPRERPAFASIKTTGRR
jgi:hypothetical protein